MENQFSKKQHKFDIPRINTVIMYAKQWHIKLKGIIVLTEHTQIAFTVVFSMKLNSKKLELDDVEKKL